jgi:hypothetical protein
MWWPSSQKCVPIRCSHTGPRNPDGTCTICPPGKVFTRNGCVSTSPTYPPGRRGRYGSIGIKGRHGSIGRGRRGSRGSYRSDDGIIEYFQNTISSESPKLFNYKFLAIVIIVIIIAIFIYIMREQNL